MRLTPALDGRRRAPGDGVSIILTRTPVRKRLAVSLGAAGNNDPGSLGLPFRVPAASVHLASVEPRRPRRILSIPKGTAY
jgi:hypothetical protein